MYVFALKSSRHKPVPKEIENMLDVLISEPYVILTDPNLSWKLGHYAKDLRDRKLLHVSSDLKLKESIAILKVNNYYRPNIVKKRRNGKTIEYIFEDTLIPKAKFPEISLPSI